MGPLHCAGVVLFAISFIAAVHGQLPITTPLNCPMLTLSDLGSNDSVSSEGIISRAVGFPVQIVRFNILCLSSGGMFNTYQSTSVLVGYFCPSCPGNGTMEEIVEQFTFDCSQVGSNQFVWNNSDVMRALPTELATFNSPTNTNCALCEHPDNLSPDVRPENHNQSDHCISKCYLASIFSIQITLCLRVSLLPQPSYLRALLLLATGESWARGVLQRI